jgi:hypothetical protein
VGRRCAIKVIHPGQADDETLVERFRAEARRTSRLTSPHSVMIYDFGHDDRSGWLFLAMEFLDGEDLGRRIASEGQLPLALIVEVISQAARSLQEAHDLGIVHRDIKPGNLMLVHKSGELQVKVIDFGIAKSIESSKMTFYELTGAGLMIGTPQYMAPEQITGGTIDGRTDQYALAITAYKMLTGRTPFEGGSAIDIATRQVCDAPLPPRAYRPELASYVELEAALLQAMSKSPSDRFSKIEHFAAAVIAAFGREKGRCPPASSHREAMNPRAEPATAPGLWDRQESSIATTLMARPDEVQVNRSWSRQKWPVMAALTLAMGSGALAVWATGTEPNDERAPENAELMAAQGVEIAAGADESRTLHRGASDLEQAVAVQPTTGIVEVTLPPGGRLFVGGAPFSERPHQVLELPAGEHLLTLRMGEETRARKTVDVQPGSLTMVELLAP